MTSLSIRMSPFRRNRLIGRARPITPRKPVQITSCVVTSETFDLPVTITNCSNNYGPYQFPEKVIPLFTTSALANKPLTVYQSSANRREWLHVEDAALFGDRPRAFEGSPRRDLQRRFGHRGKRALMKLVDAILAATGRPPSLKMIVPDRPGHDRRYLLDSTKLRTELGWKPAIEFQAGLSDTVAWYAAHEDWWKPLIGRSPVAEGAWQQPDEPSR